MVLSPALTVGAKVATTSVSPKSPMSMAQWVYPLLRAPWFHGQDERQFNIIPRYLWNAALNSAVTFGRNGTAHPKHSVIWLFVPSCSVTTVLHTGLGRSQGVGIIPECTCPSNTPGRAGRHPRLPGGCTARRCR